MNNEINPYAAENGIPIPGKELEWAAWGREAMRRHLDALSPEERKKALESKLRIAHRMQSEQTTTPSFEDWKKQVVADDPWLQSRV